MMSGNIDTGQIPLGIIECCFFSPKNIIPPWTFCQVSLLFKFWSYLIFRGKEKAMAPHSSTLAWKIPWMVDPGRLQSMGSLRGRTQLSDFTFTFHFHAVEKEMATHSSVLAWRTPGTAEPGRLPSVGSHGVGHD